LFVFIVIHLYFTKRFVFTKRGMQIYRQQQFTFFVTSFNSKRKTESVNKSVTSPPVHQLWRYSMDIFKGPVMT